MIGLNSLKQVSLVLVFASLLGACAKLPENTGRTESYAYTDTGETSLGVAIAKRAQRHPGQSGFFLLDSGLDAFVARAALAQTAERSIDTQYYMIHNDIIGNLFIDQLYKAADRGVRVRLLVDDIDQGGRDVGAAILDTHPNIEVRIFNPFGRNTSRSFQFVTGLGKQTRRAHNKSFTVDSQVTILGGRNIGDEYFEADPNVAFVDVDVLGFGQVAKDVSISFDLYWNSELSYPISTLIDHSPTKDEIDQRKQKFDEFISQQADTDYMLHLKNSNFANQLRAHSITLDWGKAVVVADEPDKLLRDTDDKSYHMVQDILPHLESAQKELIIYSPYFVPGTSGVAFFKQLRDRGVRVSIVTNSLASNDVSIVHAGYARYRKDLLRIGVELHELNKKLTAEETDNKKKVGLGRSASSLHAKAFVIDRQQVFIGSLNLDARSIKQNTEIGVVFESNEIADFMGKDFDQNVGWATFRLELYKDADDNEQILWHGLVDGSPKTFVNDPYTGFWKRLGVSLMGLFPIESQI